jgi:hypothetical protein
MLLPVVIYSVTVKETLQAFALHWALILYLNRASLMISIERQQKLIHFVRTAGLPPPPPHLSNMPCSMYTSSETHSEVLRQVIHHTTTLPLHHVKA